MKVMPSLISNSLLNVLFQSRYMSSTSFIQNINTNRMFIFCKQRKQKTYFKVFLQKYEWMKQADELAKTYYNGGQSEEIIKVYHFPKIILPHRITNTFEPKNNLFYPVRTQIKIAVVQYKA